MNPGSCRALAPVHRRADRQPSVFALLARGALGAAFAVVLVAVALVADLAGGFGAALAAVALGAALAAGALAGVFAAALGWLVLGASATSAVPAAASRLVRESAARALPAAVCSPFAFDALPAAMRALAALVAWALLVWRAALPVAMVAVPPSAAFTLSISRLLRRAAALGWMAPTLAAL